MGNHHFFYFARQPGRCYVCSFQGSVIGSSWKHPNKNSENLHPFLQLCFEAQKNIGEDLVAPEALTHAAAAAAAGDDDDDDDDDDDGGDVFRTSRRATEPMGLQTMGLEYRTDELITGIVWNAFNSIYTLHICLEPKWPIF